jgi:hypothetical protein
MHKFQSGNPTTSSAASERISLSRWMVRWLSMRRKWPLSEQSAASQCTTTRQLVRSRTLTCENRRWIALSPRFPGLVSTIVNTVEARICNAEVGRFISRSTLYPSWTDLTRSSARSYPMAFIDLMFESQKVMVPTSSIHILMADVADCKSLSLSHKRSNDTSL